MTALLSLGLQPWAQTLGWTLIHFLWQGAALGLLAGLALFALRGAGAAARYAIACAFLLLMVAVPAATFLWLLQPPPPAPGSWAFAVDGAPSAQALAPLSHRLKAALDPSLPGLLAGWAAGVVLLSLRFLGSWVRLQRLRRRSARPVPSEWHLVLSKLCRELRLARTVRLLQSAAVEVPTALGWLRPVILLPVTALTGLSPEALEAILAHELAHIRRGDFLVNLLQSLVEVLLFYHPAVWWLSARIRAERELCCDDVAAELCGDPLLLARALADLETLRSTLNPAPTHLALAANGGSLMHRIRHLLHPALPVTSGARATALGLLAASLLGAAGVAFQDKQPEAAPKPDRTTRVAVADEGRKLDVRMKGDVTLNGEAPDPVTIAGDGSFRVEEKQGGKTRTYSATRDKATYAVDGKEVPLDKEGRDWLRTTVTELRKAQAHRGQVRGLKLVAEQGGTEGEREKVRAEPRRVRVQVVERQGDGPAEVILDEERGPRHRIEKRVQVLREEEDGPETIIIDTQDGSGPKVEKRIKVLKEGDGKTVVIQEDGDGKTVTERRFKVLRKGEHPEGGEEPHGHDRHLPPIHVPAIKVGPLPHPGSADAKAEMAAIKAELKALQSRLEQLQKQLAVAPKGTKGSKAVPPVPPPPPPPPVPPAPPAAAPAAPQSPGK